MIFNKIGLVDLINVVRNNTGEERVEQPILMDGVLGLDALLRKNRIWPFYFADYCLYDSHHPVLWKEAARFGQEVKTKRLWEKFQTFADLITCGPDYDEDERSSDGIIVRPERRADPFLLSKLEKLIRDGYELPSPGSERFACIISNDKFRDWGTAYPIATANRDSNDVPAYVVPFSISHRILSIPKLGIHGWCWAR